MTDKNAPKESSIKGLLKELDDVSLDTGDSDARLAQIQDIIRGQLPVGKEEPARLAVNELVARERARVPSATEQPTPPRTLGAHLLLAGAAAQEAKKTQDELAQIAADAEVPADGASEERESDEVKITRIKAAVERERDLRAHLQAVLKIQADERTAALTLEIKRLEGEQEQARTRFKAEADRAQAAETRAGQLEQAKLTAETALATEKQKGWFNIYTALIGIAGAVVGAGAKWATEKPKTETPVAPAASKSVTPPTPVPIVTPTTPAPTVTVTPKPKPTCVLKVTGLSGLDHPERVALRLAFDQQYTIPARNPWVTATEITKLSVEIPMCEGEFKVYAASGDASKNSIPKHLNSFQEPLFFKKGSSGTYTLGSLPPAKGEAILAFTVVDAATAQANEEP